ncbi:primosomal protein N' (replication factor Y) [Clostridium pascui]|uniref:primosomal protein N' n=1 Tax=Clostridium pascui TaxID=46609 RepID=UPI0019581866|nr:primosomal protein N' (replication factor Y) [Clostridium pascui]
MDKYAGVIINSTSIQLDKVFTYKIPDNLIEKAVVGSRVYVPFGLGNKKIDGFIMEIYKEIEDIKNIKEIVKVDTAFPLLTPEYLTLIQKMREKYLSTHMEVIRALFPSALFKGMKNKKENLIYTSDRLNEKFSKEPYTSIYKVISENNGLYTKSALSNKFNISLSSINTMLKHNFLTQEENIINRYNSRQYEFYEKKALNNDQKSALNKIIYSVNKLFLIHGVTGSGKTEIYMNLVEEMINKEKESIILVPEISLTPQMVERFKGRFGKDITVFHSKLSEGERYDEWLRVKDGKVKVAIGARSAIFLPFKNLGLIVIDEEHENSYKSDSNPKYHAREIGEMLSDIYGCKLVLGSATPSIETYYRAINNKLELITIKKRADGALLPDTHVVDMREELVKNNKSMFSSSLFEGIKDRLEKNEQIILFLNRRGFSTFVSCRKCGYVFRCSNCDISLTYHNNSNNLSCHYCGKSERVPQICPECGSKYVKYFGVGTEKVEEEVKKYFPAARVLRMDFDTTRRKNSYENIYNFFKEQKADVLVGTQMIAKGLDFKNVTLVGVIAADLSLNIPDFHSSERTFQLITQVAGRAGRGKKKGEVIVQTYNPESYSIQCAAENSYEEFFEQELSLRRLMNYPPFSELMLINMSSPNEELLIKNIQNVAVNLKSLLQNTNKIEILGPCPSEISKIKNNYRWQIIIKGQLNQNIKKEIKNSIYDSVKESYNNIRIIIDVNPLSLI